MRTKYFPLWPDLTQSILALTYMSTQCGKFQNIFLTKQDITDRCGREKDKRNPAIKTFPLLFSFNKKLMIILIKKTRLFSSILSLLSLFFCNNSKEWFFFLLFRFLLFATRLYKCTGSFQNVQPYTCQLSLRFCMGLHEQGLTGHLLNISNGNRTGWRVGV